MEASTPSRKSKINIYMYIYMYTYIYPASDFGLCKALCKWRGHNTFIERQIYNCPSKPSSMHQLSRGRVLSCYEDCTPTTVISPLPLSLWPSARKPLLQKHFVGKATDLGITLFAFIKAQALQARRARDGTFAANLSHRRSSDADAASAVIAANLSGIEDSDGKGAIEDSNDKDRAGTSASPQAWAKLSSLTYIRARTNEKLSFPAGLVVLLKSISGVLNHAIGTGELAVGHRPSGGKGSTSK